MTEKRYHTIVVGGGIAGLTAAAFLAKGGSSVLLVEKNAECGGLVNSFTVDGFRFEAGVRALLNAGIIFPMLQQLGIELNVVKSPVSIGLEKEIMHVKDISSLEDYRRLLEGFYPGSEAEISEMIRIIRKVMKDMDVLYGIENPNFKDLRHDRDFLFKQLLPWLPRFLFTIGRINRMNMPVESYLGKLIKNRSLLDIITQHFFKNTPSFFALSYFSLYLDYFYPLGGVGRLAGSVEERYLELGGMIRRETVITRVIPGEHIVTDQNNENYQYDNLIWAADLKTFYRITDTRGLSKRVCMKFEKQKNRLLEKRGGDSVYTLYLGVDEPREKFGEISHGHFFYTPSRQGLGETHWSELNSLLAEGSAGNKSRMLAWLDKFISLNTFEISIPSLRDPGMAPEGKTGLIISILAGYDLFRVIDEAGWYKEFITETENRIIRVLTSSVYPMLKDKIISRFSFTPLSYERRVGSSEGAITGWAFTEPVPVINKIQLSNRAVLTPIPSIYQAGQWTYSPAGVPMSILTGKLAAKKISGA
ncbi:MAG: NAD(P)/FAD-dependent oxidoreductase [Bacteroidales bacterium]|nr:NAD(P)/FAD-dependent oxidoreductase [Bacteroidales bacterium]